MSSPSEASARRRVVVVGGGVAGLEAALALRALAGGRVHVTVVAAEDVFAYRPLSVGVPFGLGEVRRYELSGLLAEHEAELARGEVTAVDPDRNRVVLRGGDELSYDDVVLALGADRRAAYPDALTFIDQRSVQGYRELLDGIERGDVTSLAFVVPPGLVWPFPLYELALQTAAFAQDHGRQLTLCLATPASAPLALFGERARSAMAEMLERAGIQVHGGYDIEVPDRKRVLLQPDGPALDVDRVVALPRLVGPRLRGVPHDHDGFIPVDDFGRVEGRSGVWAAGDCTTFPVKQGGIATQQADVVAAAVASAAGAPLEPAPFRPVLRGVLLTGRDPEWLRAELGAERPESAVSHTALWWPPTKIAGRYLAPALGVLDDQAALQTEGEGVPVEVRLEERSAEQPGVRRRALIARSRDSGEPQLIEFERGDHPF